MEVLIILFRQSKRSLQKTLLEASFHFFQNSIRNLRNLNARRLYNEMALLFSVSTREAEGQTSRKNCLQAN
eukprot:snap_masked-scaffold_39-processed-gene-0.2-mRNA-1 protein AED:1.00 eAED:1.00 QI:0/-1/0/0/-1/1/1/0/70